MSSGLHESVEFHGISMGCNWVKFTKLFSWKLFNFCFLLKLFYLKEFNFILKEFFLPVVLIGIKKQVYFSVVLDVNFLMLTLWFLNIVFFNHQLLWGEYFNNLTIFVMSKRTSTAEYLENPEIYPKGSVECTWMC